MYVVPKEDVMNQEQITMVEAYQCPGCTNGTNTQCGAFKLDTEATGGFRCVSHSAGIARLGVGTFALGMPKGFDRLKLVDSRGMNHPDRYGNHIRLHADPSQIKSDFWNKFNLPVWAMVADGVLYVRTYVPRLDWTYIDVVRGGTLDLIPDELNAVNVSEFYDDID